MARIRLLDDQEYVSSMAACFKEAKTKAEKLHPEYAMAELAYQCITEAQKGGLDSGLAKQFLFQAGNKEEQMPLVEGLDLIKAVLFLHSKLCISDPVIQATARKQDPATKRAAKCAQAYLPYMRQRMHMQERLESGVYLNVVIYGNGIVYNGWDVDGGEFPLDNIPENPEEVMNMDFKMEGDYELRNVHPRKFFADASATNWVDCEKCWEEMEIPFEKAMYKFNSPEQQEILREFHKSNEQMPEAQNGTTSKNNVKIYSYFERGRPWNGFLGSHSYFVCPENPKLLTRGPNPFSHKRLPYNLLSDIDIPDNVMGMSRIVYAYQTQLCINNVLFLINKNISLFGGNKMLLPEGAINEDAAITNALEDVVFFNPATGAKPEQIRPGQVTSDVWRAIEIQKGYINNLYGMNEFSQGQIPRELSSYAVQTAMEMDDKYRIRLFNKKKNFLKDLYYQGLENTKQYMTEPRKLNVVGLEQFTDNDYFSATNLQGDYDIDADYGPYMPVDPAARKQQTLEFIKSGFFEKAGGNMKKAASLLIDGSMLDVQDMFEQSTKRQEVEIDKIIAGEPMEINPWDNDEDHAACVEQYSRTGTFETLSPELKQAIWSHGELHVKRLAEKIAKGGKGPAGGPQPEGAGAPPPAEGGEPKPPPNPMTQPSGSIV